MASFAEIDQNNIVLNVIYVNDQDCLDQHGNVTEEAGLAFLSQLFPDKTFLRTSISGSVRRDYAAIGGFYDPVLDVFVRPQPFPSWTLNAEKYWDPPIPRPPDEEGYLFDWDEENIRWVKIEIV